MKEIKKAQDCLTRIGEMKKGTFGSALIKIDNDVIFKKFKMYKCNKIV